MVDPKLMRRMNPNYRRPAVETHDHVFWGTLCTEPKEAGVIKGADWSADEFTPDDLLTCSPIVRASAWKTSGGVSWLTPNAMRVGY